MKRKNLLAFAAWLQMAVLFAQTPKENLEKAVENYNGTRTFQNGLDVKTISNADLATIKTRMDQGLALLDKVMLEGNADQIKVARYFKMNFRYAYFFSLGMMGKNPEAYELNKLIEPEMTRFKESDFPMSYEYFEKRYTIKWENFSSTQAEYLTSIGEISYNMGKMPDAVRFSKQAIAHPGVSSFLKYVAVNKILDAYKKDQSVLTRAEYLDYVLSSIQMYDGLDIPNKQIVKDNNYPSALKPSLALKESFETDNNPANHARMAIAAPIAANYDNSKALALDMYDYCYRNNYNGSESFHLSAIQFAKEQFPSANAASRSVVQNLGDKALMLLIAKIYVTDCEKYRQYGADYQALGMASKGLELGKKYTTCVNKREEDNRRREAEQKRAARRANRKFNMYLGLDVIPLLTKLEKMDFGGHLDLRGRRVAHSFGFSMVNLRKDYNSNRTQWDGNRYFYTFKIFGKKSDATGYSGLYFGYADKTFETLLAINATAPDGTSRNLDLTPVDKQFELMWNSGMQALGKPFGVDFWFGIGASYNQLSFKELDSAEGYTFTNNDFFDNRKKLESIQLKMRMGLSVGLNFGRKR